MSNTPRTAADWRRLTENGTLLTALSALRGRVMGRPGDPVWIHRCPAAPWARQLSRVAQRLGEAASLAEALARYPLLGVPFAVKDNIDIEGEPTTAACPAFSHVAPRSATAVQRLLDAGAVWVGKTNLDQFATGLVGTRSPYGRPASVADATRISGGSSSGSAVAVARGDVAFALGTDTAGSGRIPAGFNGLVGLKPTPGRVSTAGVVPACRTLDCVSVFAHGVDDAAQVLAVIEGEDEADDYSDFAPGPGVLPARVRLGVPREAGLDERVGYPAAWAAALARAQGLGHEIVELDFGPLFEVAALLYEGPWVAERHAACRDIFDRQPAAMDEAVRRVVSGAVGRDATQVFEAQYRLRAAQRQLKALWSQVDALLVPTAPTHPTFAEVDADPLGANAQLGRYTNFVNLLGWCALAVPAGTTATGLPFGVTFIAPGGHDVRLHHLGRAWMGAGPVAPWLKPPATMPMLPLAVVGAHLSGLPLNGQLTERGAVLLESTSTAPHYRFFALPGTVPPKPGLLRVAEGGGAIALEVWAVPQAAIGSFLALIPPPLGLGSVQLADGRHVHGFLCEPHALQGAQDITALGGWRAYLASLKR
ncbi:MAG: allophanate hydrolase [Rubrivivax sp.]|nr:allophanate hydrolase [Rubrivivax sp.]